MSRSLRPKQRIIQTFFSYPLIIAVIIHLMFKLQILMDFLRPACHFGIHHLGSAHSNMYTVCCTTRHLLMRVYPVSVLPNVAESDMQGFLKCETSVQPF